MSLEAFLYWLSETQLSIVMRESVWAQPIASAVHVLTLALFIGFVVLLDMRLLDVLLRGRRVSEVYRQLNPGLFGGFAVMVLTGLLLFVADPVAFFGSFFFKLKLTVIALAGLNVLLFNLTLRRQIGTWDESPRTPWAVKLTGVVSLVLWVCVVAAGRGIAYTLPPP